MTSRRSGPFWDGVEGRAPVPPAAATLGFEFVGTDVEAGTIDVAFTATDAFTNPAGNVLGAFVPAILYDTVRPGPARDARARAVHVDPAAQRDLPPPGQAGPAGRARSDPTPGRRHGVSEAELADPRQEATIATATATARVIPRAAASAV